MALRLWWSWVLILVLANLADGALTWVDQSPSQQPPSADLTKANPCQNSIYTFSVDGAEDTLLYSITPNPNPGQFSVSDDKLYCTADTLNSNGYSSYTLTVTITDGTTTLTDTFTVTIIGLPTTTTQTTVASTTPTTMASTTPTTVAPTTPTTVASTTQTTVAPTTPTSTASTTQTSTASTTQTSTLSTTQATAASTTPTSTLSTTTTVIPDVPIEFTSPNSTTHYICESDQADDEVVALAARQGDTSTGFIFSIESTQTKFTINNANKLVVARNNSFDAESAETSYNLTLKVVLASDSKRSATMNITIKVDDINDNYPEFSKPSYNFTISERSQGGEIIGSVSATDKDATPPNNVISFTINDTTKFQISNNGTITLANNISLDNENKSTYSFTVTAIDGGTDDSALNSSVIVQVTIETAPKFADGPVKAVDIREDIGQQAYVWSLSASDRDSAPNANLEFDILSQFPASPTMFKLNGSNLTTADNTFDYENRTSYVVVVRAFDGKYNITLSLGISVLDVNEPPRFNSSVFTATVADNLLGGAIVTTVVATDPDTMAPNNTIVSYTINGSSEFRISNEGVITLKNGSSLDYRKTPYNLTVTATDGGTGGSALIGTASVIVNIESVPKFSAAHVKTASIREDIGKQTSVMLLTATDSDAAPNTILTFNIVLQTPTSPVMFSMIGINLSTSSIIFDYETQTTYYVVVRAYDGKYDSTLSLNISVEDVNDNPPRFNSSSFTTSIVENFKIDGVVVSITARDDDVTSEFAKTSYSITAGNNKNEFTIDKDTGAIRFQAIPLQQSYTLTVKAEDKHTTTLSSETNVTIIVDGGVVNECVPNPCQHNGACSSSVNNFLCTCKPGWNGTLCETNIDECFEVVCANSGICVDHVNGFTCNCSSGWTGTYCTQACNNGTYGRNCAEKCQCDRAKLPADVGLQTCDNVTGHCKCSVFWTGATCSTDVNECYVVPDPCVTQLHKVCNNTIPKFECVCKYGFRETNDTCIEETRICGAVKAKNSNNVILDLPGNLDDCNSTYTSCKDKHLKDANKTCSNFPSAKICEVCDVRKSSIVVELIVVLDNNAAKKAQFAQELQNIRDGQAIQYGDKTYIVQALSVDSIPLEPTEARVDTNKHLCEVYAIISPCDSNHFCHVENNLPYCKKKDDLPLLLGLGLGIGLTLILLFLIFVVVVAVILRNKQRSKGENRFPPRQNPLPVSRHSYEVSSKNVKRRSRDHLDRRDARMYEERGKMYDNVVLNGAYSHSGYGQGPLWYGRHLKG